MHFIVCDFEMLMLHCMWVTLCDAKLFYSVCVIRPEDNSKVAEELKRADAIVLTYACNQTHTLDRLSTFWLPKLRQLEVCVSLSSSLQLLTEV